MIELKGKNVVDYLSTKGDMLNSKEGEVAIITIGDDDASKVYIKKKIEKLAEFGLTGINYRFGAKDKPMKVYSKIQELQRPRLKPNIPVLGIMIQQPVPEKFKECTQWIPEEMDVDGLNYENLYYTIAGAKPSFYPATPMAIMDILDFYKISVEGKHVVIINRSEIVGLPLSGMMRTRNATVTICHSKTQNLKSLVQSADIIVSAIGKAKYFDASWLDPNRKDQVIIDVSMNRDKKGKLCGDWDYESIKDKCGAATPVPGGVGPVTVIEFVKNAITGGKEYYEEK